MIAFGEDIGSDMCLRTMNHLLQYGEPIIKRTVPLAIGLLRISNPEVATPPALEAFPGANKIPFLWNSSIASGVHGRFQEMSNLHYQIGLILAHGGCTIRVHFLF